MVHLARPVQHRLGAIACVAAAACSPPDWPDVPASSNGGSESSLGASPSGGTNGDAFPAMMATPGPGPVSGVGQEGSGPINGIAPGNEGLRDAGGSGESLANEPDAGGEPIEAAPDASDGTPPPAEPEPEPVCDGTLLQDVCWYLGDVGEACDDTCETHGGFSPASVAVLGTPSQGGSAEGCAAVLAALVGFSDPLRQGYRDDDRGLGCHVYEEDEDPSIAWWLTSPALSPDAALDDVRVVCGCSR